MTEPWTPAAGTFNTPTTLGVPQWQGTPEDNARMLRSAAKFYGASAVGYMAMDANTKKLVFTREYNTKVNFVFDGTITAGYELNGTRYIPDGVQLTMVDAILPQSVPN